MLSLRPEFWLCQVGSQGHLDQFFSSMLLQVSFEPKVEPLLSPHTDTPGTSPVTILDADWPSVDFAVPPVDALHLPKAL